MHPMLNIAVRAARAAGNLVVRNIGENEQFKVEEKRKNDLVTDIDRECERTIRKILSSSYPDHSILGEEGGAVAGRGESEYEWIIDPIDGTTNFVQDVPHVGISIGLRRAGKPEVGVVYDPILNEMFTAARGEGATLNGRRIRVAKRIDLESAILGFAFPMRYRERMNAFLPVAGRMIDHCADLRRTGCASLDLAYVACGRFDGYFEQGLKPWDFAAGELIVREAGGIVTDFAGTNNYVRSGNIVCGNPKIVQQMLKVIDPNTLDPVLR